MALQNKLKCRIESFINTASEECVMYPYVKKDGYGDIQYYNKDKKKRHYLAHRLSYEITNNVVLEPEQLVLHSCDNPGCINPRHLRVGTHKDNSQDKVDRGRQAKGKQNGQYKHGHTSIYDPVEKPITPLEGLCGRSLDKESAIKVKDAIRKRGSTTLKELSEILGVKYQTLKDINAGRAYYTEETH